MHVIEGTSAASGSVPNPVHANAKGQFSRWGVSTMNTEVLVDSIVRQTTVLLAQLATATGARTPLAHTANQVFTDLVRELKAQGMTHAVIADMFGLALRTYHKKLQRLSESATFRGRSLWWAILDHVQKQGPLLRKDVLHRFRNDDEATLRGVLNDMVESGVLYASGSGDSILYRALGDAELPQAWRQDPEHFSHLVWVYVYRFGPLTLAELRRMLPASEPDLNQALASLLEDGRVRLDSVTEAYSCDHCFIPVGAAQGWEASVFDHYQAVVTAICTKLRQRSEGRVDETIGGSTYRFTVWKDHPERLNVASALARIRGELVALRQRVERYNAAHDAPSEQDYEYYLTYVGQTRLDNDPEPVNQTLENSP